MLKFMLADPFVAVYVNDTDPYIPEWWANESLAILEENMVVANLVHRDFENELGRYGDIVNTRRPAEFSAKRKALTDAVTVQDATAVNVQVPLNQHVHVSFRIYDGEESKSFKGLVEEFLSPAMLAQARFIDQIVLGQFPQFLINQAGALGLLSTSTSRDYIADTRKVMNQKKAYSDGRNLILGPKSETEFLKTDIFVQAQQVGDQGSALKEAFLGRKYGFNTYMCQNMSSIAAGNTVVTAFLINNAAGYPAGTLTVTVDTGTGVVANGTWLTIAGDHTPLRVSDHTESLGNTVTLTFSAPGLRRAVLDNAVLTIYTPGLVNNGAGYAVGYAKEITIDTFTVAPQVGQIVSFGLSGTSAVYTIVAVNALVGITLDRPLEAALADNDKVNIGPAGDYNFAFHRNAVALVVRPLAMPREGTGARSATVNNMGLSMRATITYEGANQAHLVTLDMLCGVKVLDTNLGAVLLG